MKESKRAQGHIDLDCCLEVHGVHSIWAQGIVANDESIIATPTWGIKVGKSDVVGFQQSINDWIAFHCEQGIENGYSDTSGYVV